MVDNVLITGGDGTVASYIDFGTKLSHTDLDITNLKMCREVYAKHKPNIIIHLAAMTDLTQCEAEPSNAYLVNSIGTYNLAFVAKEIGAKIIYVSTDAVFPHSDTPHATNDPCSPESIYGHSKYLGELAVKSLSENYIVARTSWIFGGGKEKDKKFVAKFITNLDKPEVTAVQDERSSPTYAKDFVQALKNLIKENKTGTFHVVNSGTASRYDMACVIAKTLDKNTNITAVDSSVFGLKAFQKSSGGLSTGLNLRPWQDALADYLNSEWK